MVSYAQVSHGIRTGIKEHVTSWVLLDLAAGAASAAAPLIILLDRGYCGATNALYSNANQSNIYGRHSQIHFIMADIHDKYTSLL